MTISMIFKHPPVNNKNKGGIENIYMGNLKLVSLKNVNKYKN